jgi:hypothetical protein
MIKIKMFVSFGLDCVFCRRLAEGLIEYIIGLIDEVNSIDILRGALVRADQGRLSFSSHYNRE